MAKCKYEKDKCTLTVGTVLSYGLFIGLFFGYIFGYMHCFQSVKHNGYMNRSECTWGDIAGDEATLNDKIPAKLMY